MLNGWAEYAALGSKDPPGRGGGGLSPRGGGSSGYGPTIGSLNLSARPRRRSPPPGGSGDGFGETAEARRRGAEARRRRAAAESRKQRAERSEVATSDEDGISGYGREIGSLNPSLSPVKRAGGREGREDGPAGDDAGSPEGVRAQPRSAGDW